MAIGLTTALVTAGIASAAGGTASAVIGSRAAGRAADTQASAALRAAELQRESDREALNFERDVYNQNLKLMFPWLSTGQAAQANLAYLSGVLPDNAMYFPPSSTAQLGVGLPPSAEELAMRRRGAIDPSSPNAGQLQQLQYDIGFLEDVLAGRNPRGNDGRIHDVPRNPQTIAGYHNLLDEKYRQFDALMPQATQAGAPSAQGTTHQGVPLSTLVNPALGEAGSLLKPFEWKGPEDPAFQFRLNEGLKLLERSAAAKGGLLTGGTAKSLEQYGQDLAATEFQSAFDRDRSSKADRFNKLAAISGSGQVAAESTAREGRSTADTIAAILSASGARQGQNPLHIMVI